MIPNFGQSEILRADGGRLCWCLVLVLLVIERVLRSGYEVLQVHLSVQFVDELARREAVKEVSILSWRALGHVARCVTLRHHRGRRPVFELLLAW